jgi:hypothetical protein
MIIGSEIITIRNIGFSNNQSKQTTNLLNMLALSSILLTLLLVPHLILL